MTKLILIVVAVVAVIWLLRRALAGPHSPPKPPQAEGEAKGDLVSCARCDVKLPKSEARSDGGRFYCSEEHWRLGPQDG